MPPSAHIRQDRRKTVRKTENEPSKQFLINAFAAAKKAGWSCIQLTTPYGVISASDMVEEADGEEVNEWDSVNAG